MILLIDNYDSFTHNLVDYFEQLDQQCHIIQNDLPIDPHLLTDMDAIVLSPGPGIPENAGNLMQWIKKAEPQKPILGICLGHQALCQFYGGEITHAKVPMHGKISKIHHVEDPIFSRIPEYFNVVRYHSLVCNPLPKALKLLAFTDEDEPMAFRHKKLPIWGLQFHPEAALTEYGLELLQNWLLLIKK